MRCQTTKNQGMSSPIFLSSGDINADRRFEWARDREAKGDLAGAADLLMQALELAPSYASAWFMLGELRERLGDRVGAVAAFGQAKAANPQDVHGAALRLTRLGFRSGGAMGEGYVRALFDGYAPRFDQALTVGLNYRAPELLFRAIGVDPFDGPVQHRSVVVQASRVWRYDHSATGWWVSISRPECWSRRGQRASTTASSKKRFSLFWQAKRKSAAIITLWSPPTFLCISMTLRRCSTPLQR